MFRELFGSRGIVVWVKRPQPSLFVRWRPSSLTRLCSRNMSAVPRNRRHFYSDNNSGVHPRILDAIIEENDLQRHVHGYGDDPATQRTRELIQRVFGGSADIGVHIMWSGTGANVLSIGILSLLCSVICFSMLISALLQLQPVACMRLSSVRMCRTLPLTNAAHLNDTVVSN